MPDVLGICQKIWAEVLEMPDVAPDDDFWQLGGHSLLAVCIVDAVRAELAAFSQAWPQAPVGRD